MKRAITPTDREILMDENDFIVSKTDLKGRIIYANRIFMKIAGYNEGELLGVQHNIIRHPDMPRGVFRLLWNVIESGNECFAYVKNMAKSGDFYWVYANVTVDYDDKNNPIGYFSVRRKPSREGIEAMIPVYKEMLRIEQQAGARDAPNASLQWLVDVLKSKNTTYEEFIHTLGH
ncbi:MAG: PAS domain-containing protein [Candidatus Thiodiazotropha sp. (ex. Lucinisca nassula)]|nr:PAS domain-containing protein [Candidatus Thiodiazotropha sp. (ex. Lucinisca nassula)]MBW9275845.1 PAS domain-containing protein [Candidatus Thiodiazotropha sp. (ex. Lucinisca nassula)]PUB81380.1 MAG: aerotaxis receptor Aer [gamma proteobacterium symbiont of Ctena orbiculata]PUB91609.1 MAG: aerotaxis receptor Aer [gamma proteobacterium symbiont of Ctena orbiculata]